MLHMSAVENRRIIINADLADTVIGKISDKNITCYIKQYTGRPVYLGRCRRPAIAAKARSPGTGNSSNDPRSKINLPEPVIMLVRNVKVIRSIQRNAIGII